MLTLITNNIIQALIKLHPVVSGIIVIFKVQMADSTCLITQLTVDVQDIDTEGRK